jgi:hypothetical protein
MPTLNITCQVSEDLPWFIIDRAGRCLGRMHRRCCGGRPNEAHVQGSAWHFGEDPCGKLPPLCVPAGRGLHCTPASRVSSGWSVSEVVQDHDYGIAALACWQTTCSRKNTCCPRPVFDIIMCRGTAYVRSTQGHTWKEMASCIASASNVSYYWYSVLLRISHQRQHQRQHQGQPVFQ